MTKNIKSYIGLTLICMISSGLAFLPVPLSFVFEIVTAAAIAAVVIKHHYMLVFATSFISLAVYAALGGFAGAAITGVTVILLGLSMGIAAKTKLSFNKLLFLCSLLYVINMSAVIILAQNNMPEIFSLDYYFEMIESSISQLKEAGYFLETEQYDLIMQTIRATVLFIMQITPAIIILCAIVCAYVLIRVSNIVLKKLADVTLCIPSFSNMRLGLFHGIIFLIIFLFQSVGGVGRFADLLENIFIILSFLFFTSGLSFFDWQMAKRGKKKSTRIITIALVLLVSYFLMFMPVIAFVIMGVLDSLFNFRNKVKA